MYVPGSIVLDKLDDGRDKCVMRYNVNAAQCDERGKGAVRGKRTTLTYMA
jgi:hypothetical protein